MIQPIDGIFLCGLCREYEAGLDQFIIENFVEKHFVFDMDNVRDLDVKGTKRVTYTELSSGRDSCTVDMWITGGTNCQIADPMIFKNKSRKYVIREVSVYVLGVCCRTEPNFWIYQTMFPIYFTEPRAINSLSE